MLPLVAVKLRDEPDNGALEFSGVHLHAVGLVSRGHCRVVLHRKRGKDQFGQGSRYFSMRGLQVSLQRLR